MSLKMDAELIKVTPLQAFGKNDTGETHRLENSAGEEMLLAYRKKGSKSGNHYHLGKEARKDPEILILLNGEAHIGLEHIDHGQTQEVKVKAPCKIAFPPKVIHTIYAIDDIIFLELNSLEEHKRDTLYPE